MDEEKLAKMEEMFLQTSKPKLVVKSKKEDKIKKIGCIYDATNQGKNALVLATALAKSLETNLKVFAADDFHSKLTIATEEIREKEKEISSFVENIAREEQVATEVAALISKKMDNILSYLEEDSIEEDKLSTLIIEKIKKEKFNLLVAGSPMLRTREEKGYFGFYLRKLLRDHSIEADFLLVPNELVESDNLILGLTNYRQKQGSVEAILRKGLALSKWINTIKMIGIIEENTIQTVARSELPDNTESRENIAEVKERIEGKYRDLLESFEIEDYNLSTEVNIGVITAIVKLILEKYKPKLVIVKNNSKFDENLDPEAETLARITLNEGYPILLEFGEDVK